MVSFTASTGMTGRWPWWREITRLESASGDWNRSPTLESGSHTRHGRRVRRTDAVERDRIGHDGLLGPIRPRMFLSSRPAVAPARIERRRLTGAALLVGDQPRDAVQTHRLQRIPCRRSAPGASRSRPARYAVLSATRLKRRIRRSSAARSFRPGRGGRGSA